MTAFLNTVILVYQDETVSPILTTTREYGRWLETQFDAYTCQKELYLKTRKKDGTIVEERHPGTRIGAWFDGQEFGVPQLQSYFIPQKSKVMDWLQRYKLAELRDAVPISVTDSKHRKLLRLYTLQQIELYVKSNIYRRFDLSSECKIAPRQIRVTDADMKEIIFPQKLVLSQGKKRLF